jgi:hypothetical protein
MWIETPEERVRKNRSLRVDEAETSEFAPQPQMNYWTTTIPNQMIHL